MNAVCTIVSKNYLAQALTLGDSMAITNPDVKFHILLADEKEELDLNSFKYSIIEFKNLGLPFWEDMAFKYDIIEFNTATKPFFMQWLFKQYGYEKLLYIDPDCAVYSRLDYIFDELDTNFIAMTPHIIDPQLVDQAAIPEVAHLFDGIFNFGFVGIRNNEHGQFILQWWANRLQKLCYADLCQSLHVDQKWMDFVPSMFSQGVKIIRNYGCNISHWNFHERILEFKNDRYIVNGKDELIFFHFSGYNPLDSTTFTKPSKQSQFTMSNRSDLVQIHQEYQQKVLKNDFEKYLKMNYAYAKYDNGTFISKFNRRLYRELTDRGNVYEHPFSSSEVFYKLMKHSKLLTNENSLVDIGQVNVNNLDKKEKILKSALKLTKKILGIDNYTKLIRGLQKITKYENQIFLINGMDEKSSFKIGLK